MVGMWLNCIFGGKGVGMINMLLYVIIGIFMAGMMVGRTPEYLGKKIGAREVKLAILALLVHPFMILFPTGLFAATNWGLQAVSNPGAHGFSQMLYKFSSASANNGSAFDGLAVVYGLASNPNPAPTADPMEHRGGPGDALQPLSADHCADCHGGVSRREEIEPVRPGDVAHRHRHLWRALARDDPDHRGPALPAGGRTGARGGAFGPIPFGG